MKIAILGYSGAGKSTLARALGERYGEDVLHLDSVHFLPGWQERTKEDELKIASDFMDSHEGWVIEGNYTRLFLQRRAEEADLIILLLFNRFASLLRVSKRYQTYKGRSRPDMAQGCEEKLDGEFLRWVLWDGRGRKKREFYRQLRKQYPDKTVILKAQGQIDRYLRTLDQKSPSIYG